MQRYDEQITGAEPVTSTMLAETLRGTSPSEDAFLTRMCKVARQQVEKYCRISIVQRTVTLYLDRFPVTPTGNIWFDGVREAPISSIFGEARKIPMPLPPLQSVTSITTYDDSDNAVVFGASGYYVDVASKNQQGRVVLRDGICWPVALRVANAIKFIYVAGYVDGSVPDDLKEAIIGIAAYLYAHRGDCTGCEEACGMANLLRTYVLLDPR